MASSNAAPQVVETEITRALAGANIPDVTNILEKVISVLMMVPMGNPAPMLDSQMQPIEGSVGCNMGLPAVLWGLSGIAKSAIIKQAAKKLGLHPEVVFPSTHAPEDFGTLPIVVNNELKSACMLTQVLILNDIINRKYTTGGLLFLDEVSCAPPAVQGAMLSMVLDRKVGAVAFDHAIRILLAANPPEYSAGGWGLEAPMANRMAHFYVSKPPTDRLIEWMLSESSSVPDVSEPPLKRLQANWPEVWAQVKGLWAGWAQSNNSARHRQPKPGEPQSGYCWPSDRTWEFAFRAIATVRALGYDRSLELTFVEGCVGEGPAAEYAAWASRMNLPNARDVLENGWTIPRELDIIHTVYASMTSLVLSLAAGPERYRLAGQLYQRLNELAARGHLDIVGTHIVPILKVGLAPTAPGIPADVRKIGEEVVLKIGNTRNLTSLIGN